MPSSMIHLFVAKKFNPDACIDFYIGNVAPDTVMEREQKDITHLRNAPDREAALKEIALRVDGNEYLKGLVLHLFVDWKWDDICIAEFAKKEGEGWYQKYFGEISKMTAYAYHHTPWSDELWARMSECDDYDFVETELITKEAIKQRIQGQRKWQMDNDIGPSEAFPPEKIDQFVDDTVKSFIEWFSVING